jgi:hypothetical protein
MKHSKDLNWLSAPAFFLIIGIITFHSINQSSRNRQQEKVKPPIAVVPVKK